VHCKDKLFTIEEDRHLLCWARKYGYGQWQAVKLAVRRNPNFRFDYFLRSLPVDLLGRRCEQLMKAAEKEVEHYERVTREAKGLPVECAEGEELPPVELPMFHTLQDQLRESRRLKAQAEKQQLEEKVNEIGGQIQKLQARLKALNSGVAALPEVEESAQSSGKENVDRKKAPDDDNDDDEEEPNVAEEPSEPGATGGDRTFVPFPEYNGESAPLEWKKPFTHFCNRTRREVKTSLGPEERKNKKKINKILKERWLDMSEREKEAFR
jgi:SLIDE